VRNALSPGTDPSVSLDNWLGALQSGGLAEALEIGKTKANSERDLNLRAHGVDSTRPHCWRIPT